VLDTDGPSWSFPHNVACLATGAHSLKAVARACDRYYAEAEISVSVNTTPTVSVSTSGLGTNGSTTVSVDYSFPNTKSHLDRRIDVYRDGVFWNGAYQVAPTGPPFTFPAAETCSTTWRAIATACGRFGDPLFRDESVYAAPEKKPKIVSLALLKVFMAT